MTDLKQLAILLVEDEDELRREIVAFLEIFCKRVVAAKNGRDALTLIVNQPPDLVISDIRMPVMGGLELAAQMKKLAPDTPLIFCSAFIETDYLLKAIELQTAAFVRKPVDTDELLTVISRIALPVLQRREIQGLTAELDATLKFQLGSTPSQLGVAEQVPRVARTSFNVLLEGETGSGKSRLASIIHQLSPRREKPLVTIQLGAIPQQLAESELFGHVKGAFTGADRTRTGLVESAQGGTLFLDDIDACPPPLQAKLLRFIEEKKFTPVGSSTEKIVDLRVISASNRNLKKESQAGHFREDLYYRLADVTIALPPLRETTETIVPLALKFLRETCDELGRSIPLLDNEARQLLCAMPWPGNIRQLKSVIRRAALNSGKTIVATDIDPIASPARSADLHQPPPFPCQMENLEVWMLEQALRYCQGHRMKTAAMLGMNYYTFRRRLEKYGISADEE